MVVKKYKPKNMSRVLEQAAHERSSRIADTIAKSKKRIADSKDLVRNSKELIAEMARLKKKWF